MSAPLSENVEDTVLTQDNCDFFLAWATSLDPDLGEALTVACFDCLTKLHQHGGPPVTFAYVKALATDGAREARQLEERAAETRAAAERDRIPEYPTVLDEKPADVVDLTATPSPPARPPQALPTSAEERRKLLADAASRRMHTTLPVVEELETPDRLLRDVPGMRDALTAKLKSPCAFHVPRRAGACVVVDRDKRVFLTRRNPREAFDISACLATPLYLQDLSLSNAEIVSLFLDAFVRAEEEHHGVPEFGAAHAPSRRVCGKRPRHNKEIDMDL